MADITMPQLGETVTEGTIIRWLKKIGEQVAHDEPLFEVSTEKVDSEVPSSEEGVLSEILVEEGATVDVGTRLAVIGDAEAEAAPQATTSTPAEAPSAATEEPPAVAPATGSPASTGAPTPEPAAAPPNAQPEPQPAPVAAGAGKG
ncbi:MAG: biotin/lipoyl-containing protein, partial [Acidimicrobiales bacterium]